MHKFFALLLLALTVSGCGYFQRHHAPRIEELPSTFRQAMNAGDFEDSAWWPMFDDAVLNSLIDSAIVNNLTIEQSLARLEQFRAGRAGSRATLMPTATISGNYTDGEQQFIPSLPPTDVEYYQTSVAAAYEVDLWGKLYGSRGAAYADLIASENDLRAAFMSVTAQVARTYFAAVELRAQQKLLEQTVQSYEDYLELVEERYTRGVVPSLDVYQAQINLTSSKAQKAAVDASLATVEHGLSVLLGKYPETEISGGLDELPKEIAEISPGLPSELMLRRPDVRAALARLTAADLRWASANADRFPRITLTATGSAISDELQDVLDPENLLWNLAGGIVWPIFDGGRKKAEAARAEAAWRETAAVYQQVVLNAFREVEDALIQGSKQEERIAQLEEQVSAAENSLRRATDQYLQGVSEYLPVLLAQTSYYNAQRNLLTARRELADYRINLATALGGGWSDELIREYELARNLHTETVSK